MKQSVIDELYYDNCGQLEKIEMNAELAKLSNEREALYEKLRGLLGEKGEEILSALSDNGADLEGESMATGYRAGFKFGVRLASEIFGG